MDDLISRQAAVDALIACKGKDPFNRYEKQNIGLDWGIEALKQLPSAQPELIEREAYIRGFEQGKTQGRLDTLSAQPETHDKRTETHACDLISRQAAIDALGKDPMGGLNYESILGRLPSAQQEIVACGDCIHWICHDRRCGYWNHGVKPLDWCCHAERRRRC